MRRSIAIISSSIRDDRKSHRVALYLKRYIEENHIGDAEIMDLSAYNFPLFNERLKYQSNPSSEAVEFAGKIRAAEGVIIVTPEYNGGYPASLKNVVDLLTDEWRRKPVAISTVSSGSFGGSQVIISLQFILWKLKALTVTALFPVANVETTFNREGIPAELSVTEKRAETFIGELVRIIDLTSAGKRE